MTCGCGFPCPCALDVPCPAAPVPLLAALLPLSPPAAVAASACRAGKSCCMGACPPSCCRCWGLGITTRLRVACLSAFSAGSGLTSVLLTATAASDSDRTSGAACSPGFCTVGDSPPAAAADAACLERPVCPTAVLPTSTKLTTTAPPGSTAPCLASSAPKPSMQATTSPCKIRDTPTPLARIRLQLRGGGLFSSSKATSRPHALKPPNTRLSLVCYYLYNHNTD